MFVWAPLTYPGYFQVHSGFVPLFNLLHWGSAPLELHWTPSIATHYDPVRDDGLLAYYLARLWMALGMSPLCSIKVVFGVAWMLGVLGMYGWLRPTFGAPGACLAALVYSYLPYRIAAVYVRGAWGEALCLGLIPLGMAAVSATSPPILGKRLVALSGLVWLLIGLSQLGLAVWALLCLLGWWSLSGDRLRRLGRLLAAGTGCAVATVYALWTADWHIVADKVGFLDHFLYPAQLVSPYWGFGPSRPGWNDGLALGLGLAPVALASLTLWLRVHRRGGGPGGYPSYGTGIAWKAPFLISAVLTLLTLPLSAPFWRLSALGQLLTYPWQLIGLAGMFLSGAAGGVLYLRPRWNAPPVQAVLIGFVLLASYSYLQPRYTQYEIPPRPRASWGEHRILLLDVQMEVDIPPLAAGLPMSTPGRLPLDEYGTLRPGDTLHLILTWQATQALERDLKLFAHLLDASGNRVTQADPLLGAASDPDAPGKDHFTSQWEPGRLIVTDVDVHVPINAPPGPYHIAMGLYEEETMQRWPVDGSEDNQIMLELVTWGAR
ncbi:MAG: hypothetical protein NZ765_04050 [Anaerolineae bacterium]|nr:hypothetical protein [Anaerolineae bacterium]MDW8069989.1 hypothetical protein [Anaerolineae bacterium]